MSKYIKDRALVQAYMEALKFDEAKKKDEDKGEKAEKKDKADDFVDKIEKAEKDADKATGKDDEKEDKKEDKEEKKEDKKDDDKAEKKPKKKKKKMKKNADGTDSEEEEICLACELLGVEFETAVEAIEHLYKAKIKEIADEEEIKELEKSVLDYLKEEMNETDEEEAEEIKTGLEDSGAEHTHAGIDAAINAMTPPPMEETPEIAPAGDDRTMADAKAEIENFKFESDKSKFDSELKKLTEEEGDEAVEAGTGKYDVVKVANKDQITELCAGTKWDFCEKFNDYFYKNGDNIYVVTDKASGAKTAVVVSPDGKKTGFDAENNEIDAAALEKFMADVEGSASAAPAPAAEPAKTEQPAVEESAKSRKTNPAKK